MRCAGFREKMRTECCKGVSQIDFMGIKVDGGAGSLKQELGLNCAKSCDYFRFDKGRVYLIEFSNLHSQKEGLCDQYQYLRDNLPDDAVSKRVRKSVLKKFEPDAIISEELRSKCLNSILILHRLFDMNDINFMKKMSRGVVFVVGLCVESPSDVIAFERLRIRLSENLCDGAISSIKVLPAPNVDRAFRG